MCIHVLLILNAAVNQRKCIHLLTKSMSDSSDNIKAFRLYAPIYMQIFFLDQTLTNKNGHAIMERYTLYLSQLQLIQSEPTRFYQNNAILGNNPETSLDHIPIQVKKSDPFFIPVQFDPPQQGRTLLISYSETCPRIQYLQSNYTPIVFSANWMHIRSTQIIYILGV